VTELFSNQEELLDAAHFMRITGRVVEISGLSIVACGLPMPIGSFFTIARRHGDAIPAQIIALQGDRQVLMALEEPLGIAVGDAVCSAPGLQHVAVGEAMLGCVLDGLGRPIGEKRTFTPQAYRAVVRPAPRALDREPIASILSTGVRSIDAMHTVGSGQRLGIFAGTGVGKSVLMGMMTRYTNADVTVVALIGERGREVGDFIRKELGDAGLARSVLVVSTSNESPVLRVRASFVATAVAEYFRDQGADVLLLLDSTTRVAMAQREIGLAAGEPPTTKGYPPSVFGLLPKLLERSGKTARGSITGLYTVLVEGDDISEPISDAVRGILDGHVWLSRDLANRGHYPAVSVLESISRVMPDVVTEAHRDAALAVRRVLAVWNDIEDLVNVGAYAKGANVEFDLAVAMKPKIDAFLRQASDEHADLAETVEALTKLADEIRQTRESLTTAHNSRATVTV